MCPIIRVHKGDGGTVGRLDRGMRQQRGSDSFYPCCVLLFSSLAGKRNENEWHPDHREWTDPLWTDMVSPEKDLQTASQLHSQPARKKKTDGEAEEQQHDRAITDIRHENRSQWLGRSNTNKHYFTFPVIHHHWMRADSDISASDSISIC